eukprot:SAG22_NODE_2051_length_3077_cov_41.063465_5_plen_195_part_00
MYLGSHRKAQEAEAEAAVAARRGLEARCAELEAQNLRLRNATDELIARGPAGQRPGPGGPGDDGDDEDGGGGGGGSGAKDMVDRRLVTKLLVTYIEKTADPTQQREVLEVMGRILSFDDSDRRRAGLVEQSWSSFIFGGGGRQVRQRSSLLKAVITAFPCVSLPFLAVPLRSHRGFGGGGQEGGRRRRRQGGVL